MAPPLLATFFTNIRFILVLLADLLEPSPQRRKDASYTAVKLIMVE
jgi:hypothetical protein